MVGNTFQEKLHNKTLFLTEAGICWKITSTSVCEVAALGSSEEEGDTRMILQAQLLVEHAHQLAQCYVIKEKGAKRGIIETSKVVNKLGRQVKDGIVKRDVCEALIGLHALTGCDTVSAFASEDKWRPVQILMKNQTRQHNEKHWKGLEFK